MRPRPQMPEHDGTIESAKAYQQWVADDTTWIEEFLTDPRVQRIIDIPTKGPIFILDARDCFAPETIDFWRTVAASKISREKFFSAKAHLEEIVEWQKNNLDKVKILGLDRIGDFNMISRPGKGTFTLTTRGITSVPIRFDCSEKEYLQVYNRLVELSKMKFLCPNCGAENAACIQDGSGSDAKFNCPDCSQEWYGDATL